MSLAVMVFASPDVGRRHDFIHHHRWRKKSPRTLSPPPQHQWCRTFLDLWEEDFYTPLALRLKILQ